MIGSKSVFTLVVLVLCSACTTTSTIDRAKEFAQAGIAFASALEPALDQSLESKVRANSITLATGRDQRLGLCSPAEDLCFEEAASALEAALDEQVRKEQERVVLYSRFRLHAEVLRNYFQTLSSLATSDQPGVLGQSAQRLVEQASALRVLIVDSPQSGIGSGELPGMLAESIANSFRSKALQAVLVQTAPAISEELALQELLLAHLAEQTGSDLALGFQQQDDKWINDPFIATKGALPADWTDRRLAALRRRLDLNVVDAARKAAGTLRVAFEALAANRLDEVALGGLVADLNALATLALETDRVRDLKKESKRDAG